MRLIFWVRSDKWPFLFFILELKCKNDSRLIFFLWVFFARHWWFTVEQRKGRNHLYSSLQFPLTQECSDIIKPSMCNFQALAQGFPNLLKLAILFHLLILHQTLLQQFPRDMRWIWTPINFHSVTTNKTNNHVS